MCITTFENHTHPSNPHMSISRSCVTPDTCVDLRFEYLDFNQQMAGIIESTEDISELSMYAVQMTLCILFYYPPGRAKFNLNTVE